MGGTSLHGYTIYPHGYILPSPPPRNYIEYSAGNSEYFAAKHKILLHVMATMVSEAHSSALKK